MTIPNFSQLYKDQPTSPSAPPVDQTTAAGGKAIPDFSSLYAPEPEPRDNYFHTPLAATPEDRQRDANRLRELRDSFYNAINLKPGTLRDFMDVIPSAVIDFVATSPEQAQEAVGQFGAGMGQFASTFVDDPMAATGELAGGLVTGLVDPFIKYPLELIANTRLGYDDILAQLFGLDSEAIVKASLTGVQLTPEERAQHARSIEGNALSWAIGVGAERAVSSELVGQSAVIGKRGLTELQKGIEEAQKMGILTAARTAEDPIAQAAVNISTRDLLNLYDKVGAPQFMRNAISGSVGGIVGGASLGYLEGGTPEERLSGALTYATIGAPFGVAMATFAHAWNRGKPVVDMPEIVARQAGEIAALRMVQAGLDQPIAEILFNMSTLQERQNISATLALNSLEYVTVGMDKNGTPMTYGKNARIIPAVENPADILSIVANHNASNLDNVHALVHTRADGLNDILIAPGGMTVPEQKFFEKTGYTRGQQVGYAGKDNWIIEDAGIPDGKRKHRMELRNLVTGERVKDVKVRDITRLTSREPGDLSIYLGRYITHEDTIDPAQGFAHGTNNITRNDMPQSSQAFTEFAATHIEFNDVAKIETGPANQRLIDARGEARRLRVLHSINGSLPDEAVARLNELNKIIQEESAKVGPPVKVNGKEIQPGVNHIYNDQNGKGMIVYGGGAEVTVPGPDGPTKVRVGEPGEIVSFLIYDTQPHGDSNRLVKGSEEFYSRPNAQNVTLANQAIKEARAKEGILVSHSSLSETGGLPAFRNMRNTYARDRQIGGRLTVDSPESLKKELFNAFLDHVGLTPEGNFILDGEQLVRAGYAAVDDPTGWSTRAHPGESINTMRERIESYRLQLYTEAPDVRAYTWTESNRPLSMEETRDLLRRQITEDAVPTLHKQFKIETLTGVASKNRQTGEVVSKAGFDGGHSALPGVPFEHASRQADWIDGFVTSEGRFVDRTEGLNIARTRDQLRKAGTLRMRGGGTYEGMGTRTSLEAGDALLLSFNDMVRSFIDMNGLNPDLGPAIHSFLQAEIGKALLDMPSAVSRLADRSMLPMLEGFVDRAERVIRELEPQEQHLEPHSAERLAEARQNKEVFSARIEQIKNAEPIPFPPEERARLSRLEAEGKALREERLRDLASVAISNGFAVDYHEGGKIVLRDRETWMELPQRFNTTDEAIDFINNTGKARGVDVDGGGNNVVPPASVMSVMPSPEDLPRALQVPHQFAPNTRISAISRFLNTVAPWATPKREFFVALDNTFKSRFYDSVYLPTQTALMRLQSIRHPYYQMLNGIEKVLHGSGAPRERWKVVSQYRETMSPQEVIDKMFTLRKLNQTEIQHATRLVDEGIDIQNVYNYRRAVGEMKRGFEARQAELQAQMNGTQDPRAKQTASQKIVELNASHKADVESAKAAFGMDDKHLKIVDLFDDIVTRDLNEVSLNGVTRLARAMQNKEMSRAEFAAYHKMTGAELSAAKQLDSFYSKIAKDQDVDQSLNGYLNHFRAYTELPESTPAKLREQVLRGAMKDTPALANELLRSGEMNVYELDPIKAAVQYVNSVTANRHFNDTWKDAYNSAVESLNKVPNGRKAASRVVEEYLYGLKGVPEAGDKLAQEAFNHFMDAMGSDLRPDLRHDITSTFLAAGSGAFLGFRVAQGIRDFAQFSKLYFSRFGAARWNNGLKLAFERDAKGRMRLQGLAEEGVIPGLSVLPFLSEKELANGLVKNVGKVKDAIFAASQKGLEVSGQHNAYALAHAISYLDTRDLASRTLLDLSRGKITKDVAYKRLSMNSYDIPVAEGFDRLVTEGKIPEAVEYLAQSTGAETAFVFGLQNHPYGWGTVTGRIAGMFGTWSVWDRTAIMRLAGRGTAAERAAAMARFAMAEAATGLTGRVLGLNMRSWYMIPGMLFFGGPAFEYAQQLEDLAGLRGSQRQELAKRQLTTVRDGKLPLIGNFIPGQSAFSDWYKAYQLSNKQYGGVTQILQGLGFSIDQTQRSLLDETLGNYPQVSGR